MRDLIFACFWVVLFPAAFLSAHIGVLLWIWVSLAVPNLLLYDLLADFPFNKVVAGLTILSICFHPKNFKLYFDKITALYITFLLVGVVSQWMSFANFTLGDELFQKVIKEFVLFICIIGVMNTRHRLHMVVVIFCIAIGLEVAFETAAYVATGGGHRVVGNVSFGDNNGLALVALMIVPLSIYVAKYSGDPRMQKAFKFFTFGCVAGVVITFSRGGFIGLVAILAVMFWRSDKKFLFFALAAVVLVAGLILVPAAWFERIDSIKDADSSLSFLGRVIAWKVSVLVALDRPFYGSGFHGIQSHAVWDIYFPLSGTFGGIDTSGIDTPPRAAHSIFFEVLGDLGFLGLFIYLTILATLLLTCRSIAKRCKSIASLGWAWNLARQLEISLIGFIVAGSALSEAYFEGFWVLAAVISALDHLTRKEQAALIKDTPAYLGVAT